MLREYLEAQRKDLMQADVTGLTEMLASILPEIDKKACQYNLTDEAFTELLRLVPANQARNLRRAPSASAKSKMLNSSFPGQIRLADSDLQCLKTMRWEVTPSIRSRLGSNIIAMDGLMTTSPSSSRGDLT